MKRPIPARFVTYALLVASLAPLGCAGRDESTNSVADLRQDEELDRIRAAVERALSSPPPQGYAAVPKGVQLLALGRRDGRIAMNFSRELLAEGTGRVLEDALHQILTAASSARSAGDARTDDYTVLVNGVPLETHLP